MKCKICDKLELITALKSVAKLATARSAQSKWAGTWSELKHIQMVEEYAEELNKHLQEINNEVPNM